MTAAELADVLGRVVAAREAIFDADPDHAGDLLRDLEHDLAEALARSGEVDDREGDPS